MGKLILKSKSNWEIENEIQNENWYIVHLATVSFPIQVK